MRKKRVKLACIALTLIIGGSSSYSTEPPRAPILVLASPAEFGAYTGEILRAEGFNEFQVESPSDTGLSASYLNQFDVVILAETKLTPGQTDLLTNFVRIGGNLIAFRPDKQLAPVFGISDVDSKVVDGYVKIEGSNEIGNGLSSDMLQFHGEADQYDLKGGVIIATLYRNADWSTDKPALVSHEFGKGHAVAFTYNLPKSIVLTRQGNYRDAGLEKDGIPGIRAADMFTNGWISTRENTVNQADEQIRLLSHAIEKISSKKPLPRLWYFPGVNKSLVSLTADGENSPEKDFDAQLRDIQSKGGRITLYLKGTYIPATTVKRWLSTGVEVSAHVDDTEQNAHPTYMEMNAKVQSAVRDFKAAYSVDLRTVRNHWIVWCGQTPTGEQDFTAQAAIEANHGIRLDCNYYHYDRKSAQGDFLGSIGNFTGSGLPMKFVNLKGEVLDIYQLVTQLPDEQWDRGNLLSNFKILLDRSLDQEDYTFINVNIHTERWKRTRPEGLKIIDYAKLRKVPIWTAESILRFVQQRNGTEFTQLDWSNDQLSFKLNVPNSGNDLTVMIPKVFSGRPIAEITRDGRPQSFTVQSVKGRDYALFPATGGGHAFVVSYTQRRDP